MSKKSINQILIDFIEEVIEHNLFKPITVSLITSFILFNGFSYIKNYLDNKDQASYQAANYTPIKIKILEDSAQVRIGDYRTTQKEIKSGDTLLKILFDLSVAESDIFSALDSMKKIYDPRSIKVGDEVKIKYQIQFSSKDKDVQKEVFLEQLIINPSLEKEVVVKKVGQGKFKSEEITQKLSKHIVKYSATINNGVFIDGTDVGISPNIVMNMINLYSFDVDFQRDIRKGDKFEVLFETFYDKKGNRVRDGDILYSSLDLQKRGVFNMYLHEDRNRPEYFDESGNSVRKSLLRTPINGARISSKYGMRRHPVLGYSRMHKGIDFAAKRGTPIFAAGDGVITYRARKGGYGNFVKIRHNNKYSTAYAHASRFARGLRVGSRVKQGKVVAYVGTTGRSTGPHLHYEVYYKGKQINPSRLKGTSGVKLKGKKYKIFKAKKSEIDNLLKNTPNQNRGI